VRILGIDPGTRVVGYGVVETRGSRLHPVTWGTIRADTTATYARRLHGLFVALRRVVEEARPDEAAIEEAFYGKSAQAALRMGEGRGVAMASVAACGVTLHEYTPAEVKRAVVGNGRAHKSQVQEMVRLLLGLSEPPRPDDAADALAVAICHANRRPPRAAGHEASA